MGLFSSAKKLLAGETISFERTTQVNAAESLLAGERQSYLGTWRGANATLTIKTDGTIEYRRTETIGDTTTNDAVSGPIDSFDGPSFLVGVLGNNRRFEVADPPSPSDSGPVFITVNGERLERS